MGLSESENVRPLEYEQFYFITIDTGGGQQASRLREEQLRPGVGPRARRPCCRAEAPQVPARLATLHSELPSLPVHLPVTLHRLIISTCFLPLFHYSFPEFERKRTCDLPQLRGWGWEQGRSPSAAWWPRETRGAPGPRPLAVRTCTFPNFFL